MLPHVYLIKASGWVNSPTNSTAYERGQANISLTTYAKGEALMKALLEAAEQAFCKEGQVDSVFDCGEVSPEELERLERSRQATKNP